MNEKETDSGTHLQRFQEKLSNLEHRADIADAKFQLREDVIEVREKVNGLEKRIDDLWCGIRLWFIIMPAIIGAINALAIVLAKLVVP